MVYLRFQVSLAGKSAGLQVAVDFGLGFIRAPQLEHGALVAVLSICCTVAHLKHRTLRTVETDGADVATAVRGGSNPGP